MYVTAIIAAGGRGERLGASRPKQLLEIDGQTILERSVNAFVGHVSVRDKRVDAALEDGLSVDLQQLLGTARAKAFATPSRSDDRCDVHLWDYRGSRGSSGASGSR